MLRSLLLAFAAAAEAFVVNAPIKSVPALGRARALTPQAMVPETALASFPTTLIADDTLLLGGSAALISAIFLFVVVGTVVVNFGVMKNK